MPRRINRRDDGDIDVTRAVGEKLFGLLLACRRDGIDVEEIRSAGRSGLTERAASMLAAAVTAETIMSASRSASAAETAQRTPIAPAARLSFSPFASGNKISQAAMRTTPSSRKPAAIAWPASPKPMKQRAGLLSGISVPICVIAIKRCRPKRPARW